MTAGITALFLWPVTPLYGHVSDEIAVKTSIVFTGDAVDLSFDISSGVIFSAAFLKILDPDRNKTFEETHIRDFAAWFAGTLKLGVDGEEQSPRFTGFAASDWDFFAAGVSSLTLDYSLPLLSGSALLDYELSFFPNTAIYSLSVRNNAPGIEILEERRNEFLQDKAAIRFARFVPPVVPPVVPPPPLAAESAPPEKAVYGVWEPVRKGFEQSGILGFVRGAASSEGTAPALFFLLAAAVGFLHAFSPGHGKALVGAFLIANRGTVVHAFLLGLVITAAHTLSIYGFGFSASAAAGFFVPGEVIPLLGAFSGLFIFSLGLWSLLRRIFGKAGDHAHLLPNLRILKKESVNILIDGRAAEANEALLAVMDDEDCRERLMAAGAEDFNLCSPGCAAHSFLPRGLEERRRLGFFRTALKTGAVDGAVSFTGRAALRLGAFRRGTLIRNREAVLAGPKEFLFGAVENFARRGETAPLRETISWGRIVSFGVTGGIVPCPDALAVLLASIAAGKIFLGLWIIFFFSAGLACALILTGMILVLSGRLIRRGKSLALAEIWLPRLSSLFIMALGILMIAGFFKARL
jgi:ABC-type nickel/cobalt efflux system permease component RcnA